MRRDAWYRGNRQHDFVRRDRRYRRRAALVGHVQQLDARGNCKPLGCQPVHRPNTRRPKGDVPRLGLGHGNQVLEASDR